MALEAFARLSQVLTLLMPHGEPLTDLDDGLAQGVCLPSEPS